jgi:hypothetical protein
LPKPAIPTLSTAILASANSALAIIHGAQQAAHVFGGRTFCSQSDHVALRAGRLLVSRHHESTG